MHKFTAKKLRLENPSLQISTQIFRWKKGRKQPLIVKTKVSSHPPKSNPNSSNSHETQIPRWTTAQRQSLDSSGPFSGDGSRVTNCRYPAAKSISIEPGDDCEMQERAARAQIVNQTGIGPPAKRDSEPRVNCEPSHAKNNFLGSLLLLRRALSSGAWRAARSFS